MAARRAIDLLGAALGLGLLGPLLLLVALAIKLDSPGPVFYSQWRVGRGGKGFRLWKFRSMRLDADATGALLTRAGDPRVTRVGRLIRGIRLDEIPQLWNVLKGEMSLVGPRPEVPRIVERYAAAERRVLDVSPGITGPTQLAWLEEAERYPVGGDAEEYYVRHLLPRKLASDLEYVRSRSLVKDLGYLAATPFVLFTRALSRALPAVMAQRMLKGIRLLADMAAVGAAAVLALLIRFEWAVPAREAALLFYWVTLACAVYALAFVAVGTFRSIWRYASVEDVWQVMKVAALGGSLHIVVLALLNVPYSRAVMVLTPLLTVAFMGGMRLAARRLGRAAAEPASERRRIVIVGAGRTGESIAREIASNPDLGYEIVGFVDRDPRRQRETIHGVPVLGGVEALPELAAKHGVREAIIAIPNLRLSELRRVGEHCGRAGLEFKTLPSVGQLVRGEGKLRYLRKINLDDLLRREAVSVDEARIRSFLGGKRVMVTGAGGSIGAELCRQVIRLGAGALMMVERAENLLYDISVELQQQYPRASLKAALGDVKHVPRMTELFQRFRPEIVFHAAAYKHVPLLEDHPKEAVLNNVVGTRRLADVARAHGVEAFVLISTDKAAKPNSLMGATKKICEMYVTALNREEEARGERRGAPRFRVVRFGNVLGSAGSVVPLFQRQIENGGPITITDPEVSRFFMTIPEAVGLVLASASLGSEADVAVLDMGEPVKIARLAEDVVAALGLAPTEVVRKYVGLRPGEKMDEILWEEVEEVLPSEHDRVFMIRQHSRPLKELDAIIAELESLALNASVGALVTRISEIIPTYQNPYGKRSEADRAALAGEGRKLRGWRHNAKQGPA
jgi:FlaA1/EpsC-like NDP-sugar epimerase/lipopolysaccharide/colanic/teichoic acid biosynthesis glycosyltransferase